MLYLLRFIYGIDWNSFFTERLWFPEQNLTYVNIYFDSSTMNEISYDMRTNFEMKLSTIGGTMGLFTGFSVLSAVEILYHLGKGIISLYQRNILRKNRFKTVHKQQEKIVWIQIVRDNKKMISSISFLNI